MGEKMKKAEEFRTMMRFKDYGDDENTKEKMDADQKIYEKLAHEATLEWLEEQEKKRKGETS